MPSLESTIWKGIAFGAFALLAGCTTPAQNVTPTDTSSVIEYEGSVGGDRELFQLYPDDVLLRRSDTWAGENKDGAVTVLRTGRQLRPGAFAKVRDLMLAQDLPTDRIWSYDCTGFDHETISYEGPRGLVAYGYSNCPDARIVTLVSKVRGIIRAHEVAAP